MNSPDRNELNIDMAPPRSKWQKPRSSVTGSFGLLLVAANLPHAVDFEVTVKYVPDDRYR